MQLDIQVRGMLDTNLENYTLNWGEAMHEGGELRNTLPAHDIEDILALRDIWLTGQRALWQLAISPVTYHAISQTNDPRRRAALDSWFGELWLYWREFLEQVDLSDEHAA